MSDWQVGDLAVEVSANGCGNHGPNAARAGIGGVGSMHRVIGVRSRNWVGGCTAPLALMLAGRPNGSVGFCCECFRKIRPDEHEACEPEFVTLLKRTKVHA